MPQSLARVLVHVVFSTRDRQPFLTDAIRSEMHAYLATGLGDAEHVVVRVGGVADHVHIALFLSRKESIAKLIERSKTASSKWIKTKGREYEKFAWQKGMRCFRLDWVTAARWSRTLIRK